MVRRYSHRAIVTLQTGSLRNGEWINGLVGEIELKGQYYPSNSGQHVKVNPDGREFVVRGEFSTSAKKVDNATRIRIDSIALDEDIICWEQYQTHSVIYI